MTYWGERRDASFWIENASVEWNESQAPFHTVARLTLVPNSQLEGQSGDADTTFDVTANSTPDSTPVGSINRARQLRRFQQKSPHARGQQWLRALIYLKAAWKPTRHCWLRKLGSLA